MRSDNYIARSADVTPGGIHSQRRQTAPPMCFVRGSGSRVWDSAGNDYLDVHNAYGAIILGHGDQRIGAAVRTGIERLDLMGLGVTPAEVELAETLVRVVPSFDQVLLCNTGGEANLHAAHLARAVTGRPCILKFQGAYHGTADFFLSNRLASSVLGEGSNPDPQGGVFVPAVDATLVARYNDLASVEAIMAAHGHEVAAIFVEPYAHNIGGAAPLPGFLEGIQELAKRTGALVVWDEVITGIRHGLAGYQGVSGLCPDLATLGKALGNGQPIAAIGGRREYMDRFNTKATGDVLYSGTFNGGGGPVAAASTTLAILDDSGAYEHMASVGARFRSGLQAAFDSNDVTATVSGIGSVIHLIIGPGGPVTNQDDIARNDIPFYSEFIRHWRAHGVLNTPEAQAMRMYVTLSHSLDDADRATEAADAAIRAALKQTQR